MVPPNGRSRRSLLRAIVASGTALVGGCSAVSGEDEATEMAKTRAPAGTDRQRRLQDGPVPIGSAIGLRKVAGNLIAPVGFCEPEGGSSGPYVVDQTGEIRVLTPGGTRDEPFLDLSDKLVDLGEDLPNWARNEERGLLGLAFHPNYDENRKFYVRYSAPRRGETSAEFSHTEVLSEFRARPDLRFGNPDSERVIMAIPSPLPIHQAGAISFGPDGYLYVAMGDGGMPARAQDTTENLLGGVLRIDVDATEDGRPYSIPDDNPFVDGGGRAEFFAWGLRNPWRMSFNDGELYVADVGSALYEEVNLVRKGGNYGWPVKEGSQCIELENAVGRATECPDETDEGVDVDSLVDPVVQYPHSANGEILGFAVIGGYVYRAETIPTLTGKYVFGDYSSSYEQPNGTLFAAEPSGEGGWRMAELTVTNAEDESLDRSILSLGRGRDGKLYVLTSELPPSEADDFSRQSGEVYEIIPPAQTETTVGEPTETS